MKKSFGRRALLYGAIALGLIGVAAAFSLSNGYTVSATFESAGQLVGGNHVTIGGQPVGEVTDIELTTDNRAKITMRIDRADLTPFPVGTKASIKSPSLASVAGRYVSIEPAPESSETIPDGGSIDSSDTTPLVELDQLFNTLDAQTREGLKDFIRGSADQWRDDPNTTLNEAAYANRGFKNLHPALDASAKLAGAIARDEDALSEFLVGSSHVLGTIASQKQDVTELITNANRTARAIAAENERLDQALAVLPSVLRDGQGTFREFRTTLDTLDAFIDKAEPATKELAPFIARLKPLIERAAPTLRDINRMVKQSGKDNDLIELLNLQPALLEESRKSFRSGTKSMQSGAPILDFIRPYTPEFTAWISHFGQVAGNYDANGHYARFQLSYGGFSASQKPGYLTPIPKGSEYEKAGSRRCPGSSIQPAEDGSNPFIDSGVDCDPSVKLPNG